MAPRWVLRRFALTDHERDSRASYCIAAPADGSNWTSFMAARASGPAALAAAAAAGVAVGVALSALWRRKKSATDQVHESTIRLMTRVAIKSGAVNLSQGFPNEPPPREMLSLIHI